MILVDVAHAAWHAWESRSSVSGAFDQLRARLHDFAAGGERIILVADRPPYDRAQIFPAYKANRRDDTKGRDAVSGFVRALSPEWTVVGCKGQEADDVIASIVAESERRGEPVTVITGDKDLWCLAHRCHLRDIRTGADVDRSAVATKWGVRPDQLLDLLALAGDKADNVPGAAGVGPVGARLLLEVHGTLAAVLAAEPITDEQLADDERELERLRRARSKTAKAAKGAPGDVTLEQEAQAAEAVANEKGRQVARDKALRVVHASRADVEVSARLVALREDLALDFGKVFDEPEPQHGAGVVTSGEWAARHESHTEGAAKVPAADPKGAAPQPPTTPNLREEPRQMPSAFQFQAVDARREAIILRAAFYGPSNSGKSWTAMLTACHLAERLNLGPVFVIDSENGAALRYAKSPQTGHGFTFKHVAMPPDDYSPETYIRAIDYCEGIGARVILIDGISQEWTDAPGSVLEQVDAITEAATAAKQARAEPGAKVKQASAFSNGWAEMSPRHNVFVQRLLRCSAHTIATMRCKTAYEVKADGTPKKVGLAPIQRPGVEYEFDLLFCMADAVLTVGKTRCDRIAPGTRIQEPGAEFAQLLVDWISDTEQAPAKLHADLAKYVEDRALDGTPEARGDLLATMRRNREPMPVQTSALRLFDQRVAARRSAA